MPAASLFLGENGFLYGKQLPCHPIGQTEWQHKGEVVMDALRHVSVGGGRELSPPLPALGKESAPTF